MWGQGVCWVLSCKTYIPIKPLIELMNVLQTHSYHLILLHTWKENSTPNIELDKIL